MRRNETIRIVTILVVLIVAAIFFYPSARLWLMSGTDKAAMRDRDPAGFSSLESSAIKLGLDLRGGMHIVLKVDTSGLNRAETEHARDRALEIIRNRVDKFGVSEPQIMPQGANYIVVELPGLQDVERAQELIGKTAQLEFRFLESPEKTRQLTEKIDKILGADPFAESADDTSSASTDTSSESNAVEDLFADTTASDSLAEDDTLSTEESYSVFSGYLDQSDQESFIVLANDVPMVKKLLDIPKAQSLVPHDVEWMWGTRDEPSQGRMIRRLYLAKKKVELKGDCLVSATPGYDQYHAPQVSFQLTKDCGVKFSRITGPNVGKPLAIILDGQVESSPRINDRIGDRGVITMGGGATFENANDMSIVLQAGALPAPVKIVENSVVGPSLGQDSINRGFASAILGLVLVALIMAVYYRLSGLVSDIALIFNLFVLLSIMSMLKATLTVPGIAGIILLVGMSVDAAVLIFERIRDELTTGKTVRAAIDAGFARAAVSIIDSNISTLIVAGVLYALGTGPVKGFAVTLSLGIMVSLFSSLIVTRSIFEFRKSYAKLSI
jgi:protein-export membrane protein SecD